MISEYRHEAVLLESVLKVFNPRPDENYIDATVGGGGHTEPLLNHIGPSGAVLGIDLDPRAAQVTKKRLAKFAARAVIVPGTYANLTQIVAEHFQDRAINGILLDLGFSSDQINTPERGFSFRDPGPLDMRYDPALPESAYDFLNKRTEAELAKIFREYGEVPYYHKLARRLVEARKSKPISKSMLLEIVGGFPRPRRSQTHPATLVFQALRIAVNGELDNLSAFLPQALHLTKAGGRIIVISYHSLEDRIVKQFFVREAKDCVCPPTLPICKCNHKARVRILTKKPVEPDERERAQNPRSRSARMRAVECLP